MTKPKIHPALKNAHFARLLKITDGAFAQKMKGGKKFFTKDQLEKIAHEFYLIREFLAKEESEILKGIAKDIVGFENMRKAVCELGDAWEKN